MALIARLICIALEEASEHCLLTWHPDDHAPESFEAVCEIEYQPEIWSAGRYLVWFNDVLFCMVDAASMQCWACSDLREYARG